MDTPTGASAAPERQSGVRRGESPSSEEQRGSLPVSTGKRRKSNFADNVARAPLVESARAAADGHFRAAAAVHIRTLASDWGWSASARRGRPLAPRGSARWTACHPESVDGCSGAGKR
eukprot:9667380-Alexandrium_andersonii.AAC.4